MYYSLEVDGEFVLQLPDHTLLDLFLNTNPQIDVTQFVESNDDVIVSLATSFKLYLTSFIRDVDVDACFGAIQTAYAGALGVYPNSPISTGNIAVAYTVLSS